MTIHRTAIIGIALLTSTMPSFCTTDPDPLIQKKIELQIAGFGGKISFFAKNLKSGVTYELRSNEPVRTASTIKLPIMIECFFEAQEGKLKWDEPIVLAPEEKVSGSGVLTEFSDGVRIPVRDLMHLMIVVSDNTATNLVLQRITGDRVNIRMEALGLKETRVMRKILRGDGPPAGVTAEGMKPENQKWGIGRSSPREMVGLIEKIYRGELVSPEASAEMLAVLKRQHDRAGIARDRKDVTFAGKSGALDRLRSDEGIVWVGDQPLAMAITVDEIPDTDWTFDNPGQAMIAGLSEILIEGLTGSAKNAGAAGH